MSGHRHNPTAGTQNQGNTLGDRSCVRQSKLYRMYESGNGVKSILGTPHLCWDPNQKEGAYAGHQVYDHTRDNPFSTESNSYGNSSRNNVGYSKQGSGRGSYDDDDYQQPPRRQPQQSLKNYAGGGNNNNDYNYDNHENYPSNNNIYGGGGPAYGSGSMMSTYQAEYARSNSGRSNYSGRRDESNDSGDSYPLNKMRSDDRGSGNNASYRNMKEQQAMNGNASSFQSLRTNSKEKVAERVARSYFNNNNGGGNMDSGRGGGGANDRDRSTRPW